MMANKKLQNTIDTLLLTVVLVIGAITVVGLMLGIFSKAQNSVSNTNVYSITSISFNANKPMVPLGNNYTGTFTINIYSSTIPSFSQLFLVESVNSSISSSLTCPQYIQFQGFPSNGLICIALTSHETILPEGNNQYILSYTNAQYNITAYNYANNSQAYIKYIIFNQNGRYSYEKLVPEIPISIS